MNCKQGDLAIYVRSACGNEGKIVRCVRFAGHTSGVEPEDLWETDIETLWKRPATGEIVLRRLASDACLRPLRGDLLSDETEQARELVHAR